MQYRTGAASYVNTHTNLYSNTYSYAIIYTDYNVDLDAVAANADTDINCYAFAYANADTDINCYSFTYPNADTYANTNAYS